VTARVEADIFWAISGGKIAGSGTVTLHSAASTSFKGQACRRAQPERTPTLTTTSNANTSRSVPTKDQVLIPESLLKKRKTQEKTQAERDAARVEKKKV
jgi:hypothetical protein